MITALVSRLIILTIGTLYPAYASYKAVRAKDVREYVTWMMYWIVFALFTCAETFTDVFLSFWFPFYYELKVALVFWMLSPTTRGSSFLYRNFVHPTLQKRESEIDDMIVQTKERWCRTVLNIGSKGILCATNVILQTAMTTFSPEGWVPPVAPASAPVPEPRNLPPPARASSSRDTTDAHDPPYDPTHDYEQEVLDQIMLEDEDFAGDWPETRTTRSGTIHVNPNQTGRRRH